MSITIVSQPSSGKLMSAYRPIINRVNFSNNVVPIAFNITASGSSITFYTADLAPFVSGYTTVTISNAGALNGTKTVFSISQIGFLTTITFTTTVVAGNYPEAYITLDSTLQINPTLSGIPKIVYCDVYIQSIFYKTFTKTHPISGNDFEFDIQDAAQEYIEKRLNTLNGTLLEDEVLNIVSCKFRSSTMHPSGFILPDTPIPVQGTSGTAPTSGGGTTGNNFYIVNCVLQHTDSQDVATHLNSFKYGLWSNLCYPLSHRPNFYTLSKLDSDFYPLINRTGNNLGNLRIYYRRKTDTLFSTRLGPAFDPIARGLILYIPTGPKNLIAQFPMVDWNNVYEYYLTLTNDLGDILCTTPKIIIGCDSHVRLLFYSYCGAVDGINFIRANITHDTNFNEYQKSLPSTLSLGNTGAEKVNISANDIYKCKTFFYQDSDMIWAQELLSSPKVMMNNVPVIITSKRIEKQKAVNDFRYEMDIEFKLANEYLIIRN